MKVLFITLIISILSLNLFADEGYDTQESESSEVVVDGEEDSSSEESYSDEEEAESSDSSDLSEY